MINTKFDYAQIDDVSRALDNGALNITPQLETLRVKVDGLLADGLVLEQASPAMKEAYTTFHNQLVQAIEGIPKFATQFRQLKTAIQEMDSKVATDIRAAGSGGH
jgi:predicted NACHT family NTPase